ncbi:hypothetical protein BSKO_00953 [Bryopsis sp. KO-2023]|nr:hypothetical protein BSKO_00953 [Bryopsis sp. KO-2023]
MAACSLTIPIGKAYLREPRFARKLSLFRRTLKNGKARPMHMQATSDSRVDASPQWPKFLATLFATGAIAGPLLDGIHSRVHLQTYRSLPIDIDALDFHTSLWVPPLLGLFYVVLGTLQPFLDVAFEGQDSEKLSNEISLGSIAIGFAVLAAGIELSAFMYERGYPYIQIHAVLALFSLGVWRNLDGTRQGVILGLISAVGGLVSEFPIQNFTGWWDYSRPDVFGLVSWTCWCYFFYTPVVGNLGRKLWRDCGLGEERR